MNTLHFIGNMAAPATTRHHGDTTVTNFTLIRNEYRGKDKEKRKVALNFTAYGDAGETIARLVQTGHKLAVEARIENNNYEKDGQTKYDFRFVVQEFEFLTPGKKNDAGGDNHPDYGDPEDFPRN